MSQIVCAGHVNWDVTLQVDTLPPPDGEAAVERRFQAGGGSASNTAAVLAGLDCCPLLLGSVGSNETGELVRRELEQAGVDCTYLIQVAGDTTVKYLVVDGDGQVMVLSSEGVNEAFDATDIPAKTVAESSHLHLTGQEPETAEKLIERAHEQDISVSFDPGRRVDSRAYGPSISAVDTVFLNAREMAVAREKGVLRSGQCIVTKRGGDGAALYQDGETISHPGFSVDVIDTTGAGDAFAGGFLAARDAGFSLDEALAVGNACGAIAVQSVGARTTLSWERVAEYVENSL